MIERGGGASVCSLWIDLLIALTEDEVGLVLSKQSDHDRNMNSFRLYWEHLSRSIHSGLLGWRVKTVDKSNDRPISQSICRTLLVNRMEQVSSRRAHYVNRTTLNQKSFLCQRRSCQRDKQR